MIDSLVITNYALIRNLELAPCAGFNIITGETGAGKSIIMGALGLLQGKRADVRAIKAVGEKSVVSARFSVDDATAAVVAAALAEGSIESNPGNFFSLTREILPSGRSRAMVNDVQVPLTVLSSIANSLVEIHSQHSNALLADSDFQLSTIDLMADNEALLAKYHATYARYREALTNFKNTRDEIEHTGADADYLEFQLSELAKAELVPGEEAELEQAHAQLANASMISERLGQAATALTWGSENASDMVSAAIVAIRLVAELDEEYAGVLDRLETIKADLDDVGVSLGRDASATVGEPGALDRVEQKLDRIRSLKAKHRVDSVDALIEIRDAIASRLRKLKDAPVVLKTLENQARELKKEALGLANELSERRKAAAADLAKRLTERARPLGLDNLVVEINLETGKLNANGIDTIEYLFAFNKNQQPAPVGGRASGGEISRVMLALKSIIAEYRHLPTIIFDEIDTGVSGDVARRMGALMAGMSRHMQVLTITHLPQVASYGECHFKVFKTDDEKSTSTQIRRLDAAERQAELALMLSGDATDTAALATALNLLNHI